MSNKLSTKKRNLPIIRAVIRSVILDTIFGDRIQTALFITAFDRDNIRTPFFDNSLLSGYAVDKSVFENLTDYELNEMFLINPHNNSFVITAYGKRIIKEKGQLIKPRLFKDYYFSLNDIDTALQEYDNKYGTEYSLLKNYGLKSEPFYGIPIQDKEKDKKYKEDSLIYLYVNSDKKSKRIAQLKFFNDGSSSANFPIDFIKHFGISKQNFKKQYPIPYHKGYYIDEI